MLKCLVVEEIGPDLCVVSNSYGKHSLLLELLMGRSRVELTNYYPMTGMKMMDCASGFSLVGKIKKSDKCLLS